MPEENFTRKDMTTVLPNQIDHELEVPISSMLAFHWKHGFRSHFNICRIYECPPDFETETLKCAIQHLIDEHEALRMRFDSRNSQLVQILRPVGSVSFDIDRYNVKNSSSPDRIAKIEEISQEVQSSLRLDIERPLIRVAHIDLGPSTPGRIIFAVHHFIIDGFSFDLLLKYIDAAYCALRAGSEVELQTRKPSLSAWLHAQNHYANFEAQQQLAHWASIPWDQYPRFFATQNLSTRETVVSTEKVYQAYRTIHHFHHGNTTVSEEDYKQACNLTGRYYVSLPEEESKAIFETQFPPEDICLLALVEALAPLIGSRRLFLAFTFMNRFPYVIHERAFELLGHIFEQIPIILDLENVEVLKEQLDVISKARKSYKQGLALGPLKFLNRNSSLQTKIDQLPYPEICFNIWTNNSSTICDALTPAVEFPGVENALSLKREFHHASLWIQLMLEPSHLRVELRYPPDSIDHATVNAIAARYTQCLLDIPKRALHNRER